jgi:hypothetical protein
LFLTVSVDQFSQNLYSSIINQQSAIINGEGGGADISKDRFGPGALPLKIVCNEV